MKTPLIILSLVIGLSLNAQEKFKIYYDNRANTVVRFLSQSTVPLILTENAMSGFSTVNFSVSQEGKIISINNLLKSNDLFFKTAKDAIEKSSGMWIIKPGFSNQTFQITFFIISDRLDSLRKADRLQKNFRVPLNQYIKYDGTPQELTLLPTINIIFKESVFRRELVY